MHVLKDSKEVNTNDSWFFSARNEMLFGKRVIYYSVKFKLEASV